MNTDQQNERFDALDGLTDGQREYLIAEGRVACTEARWTLGEALEAIGPAALESTFGTGRLRFGGNVLTRQPLFIGETVNPDAMREAEATCAARGWGERIIGTCSAILPADDMDGGGLSPELN